MSINATLIGQMITFALLVWFTMKYVWPPIIEALEERKKKIADGLAAAEHGKHEMELADKRATDVLKDAKNEASDIISMAQKRAGEIVDESKHNAKAEGDRLITAAKAEINQEVQQAKEVLREQVSVLAVDAAEKILEQEVDKSKHQSIVKKIASQLGSQS